MSATLSYSSDTASVAQIKTLLNLCDTAFRPPLSTRVDVPAYAAKITQHALRLEAWQEEALVGLLAVYCNDQATRTAHLTNLCVLPERTRSGIADQLMSQCMQACAARGMREINLEVSPANGAALRLYEKWGFHAVERNDNAITMQRSLQEKEST